MSTQFYILCQEAILYEAWNYVKSKGAAGNIEGVTIKNQIRGNGRMSLFVRHEDWINIYSSIQNTMHV